MAAKWKECIEDIRVPDTDTRKYRYLELLNRLKVVVISDDEAKKGAAALTVQSGELSSVDVHSSLTVIWYCNLNVK